MEEKHNHATRLRPEGERAIDADLIAVDIRKYETQLHGEEAYRKNGKNAITVFKSDQVTITLISLTIGSIIKPIGLLDISALVK